MLTAKRHVSITTLLLAAGAVLVIYGVFFHSLAVLPEKEQGQAMQFSQAAVIRDITVGGLKRLPNGTITRTYTGMAPTACPT